MEKTRKEGRPVRCVETGEVWNSRKELAMELHRTPSNICLHIKFYDPIDGLHYENV